MDMGGDFIGRWRAGSGRRTARQPKPGQYSAKVLACGSLLLSCVIVAGMATQTALAEIAAPASTRVAANDKEQGGPGVAQASRAHAFLRERAFVTPDDVKAIAPDVLRHRVLTTYEAEAEEVTSDQIVQRILAKIESP